MRKKQQGGGPRNGTKKPNPKKRISNKDFISIITRNQNSNQKNETCKLITSLGKKKNSRRGAKIKNGRNFAYRKDKREWLEKGKNATLELRGENTQEM